jgi:hypothetical protein
MKTIIRHILEIILLIVVLCQCAIAQTNLPPIVMTNSAGQITGLNPDVVGTSSASANPTGLSDAGTAFLGFLQDAQPFYGTNSTMVYDLIGLYNQGHVGGLFAAHIPITSLSSSGQVSAGAAIAWFRNSWYSLALNAQAGTTWKVPLIGNVFTSIGSGPDYNSHTHSVGAFSYANATKGWDITKGHVFSLTGGVGTESTIVGPIYFGGVNLSL